MEGNGKGKGATQTAEKKGYMQRTRREERKKRSDKREASTMEANKENPNGGINHCSTYPCSL